MPVAHRKAAGATALRWAGEFYTKIHRRGWAPPVDFCGFEHWLKPSLHPSTHLKRSVRCWY